MKPVTLEQNKLLSLARVIVIIAGLALLPLLMLLYRVDPAGSSIYPTCFLYSLSDLYCAGCGGLRAVHHLLQGDIPGAMRHNILLVLLIPFVLVGIGRMLFEIFMQQKLPDLRIRRTHLWLFILGMITFMILRNIHAMPFLLLAPY